VLIAATGVVVAAAEAAQVLPQACACLSLSTLGYVRADLPLPG